MDIIETSTAIVLYCLIRALGYVRHSSFWSSTIFVSKIRITVKHWSLCVFNFNRDSNLFVRFWLSRAEVKTKFYWRSSAMDDPFPLSISKTCSRGSLFRLKKMVHWALPMQIRFSLKNDTQKHRRHVNLYLGMHRFWKSSDKGNMKTQTWNNRMKLPSANIHTM